MPTKPARRNRYVAVRETEAHSCPYCGHPIPAGGMTVLCIQPDGTCPAGGCSEDCAREMLDIWNDN